MAKSQRMEGQIVAKKIIYGSVAVWRTSRRNEDRRTHKWTAYVRGPNHEDLSYFIKRVQFDLHPTFEEPVRIVDSPPFETAETGWGEFEIKIKVFFHDMAEERPLELSHYLKLYNTQPQQPQQATGGSMRPSLQAQNVPKKSPVVAEKYDEILFVHPTEAFYEILTKGGDSERKCPVSMAAEIASHGFQFREDPEVSKLEEAKSKLKAQIAQLRDKYQQEEETLCKYVTETDSLAAQICFLQEKERMKLREGS